MTMATTTTNTSSVNFGTRLSGVWADMKASWERYSTYRRTVAELTELSDRELADLGIARASIRSIALEAADGVGA